MSGFNLFGGDQFRIHGLRGSAGMFHLTTQTKRAVIVVPDQRSVQSRAEALQTFCPGSRVFTLPHLDGSPFSFASTHPTTRRTRLLTFAALGSGDWDYLVTSPRALLECLPPPNRLANPCLDLVEGGRYDLPALARRLTDMGYKAVDLVSQPGDFAVRGGILDIYSFADEKAYRCEWFDDELEEIRIFDPANQRSTGHAEQVVILPMYEWVIGPEESATFGRKGGELWNLSDAREAFLGLVAQLRDRGRFSGYLHWTQFFFTHSFHLPDLLPQDTVWFVDDNDAVNAALEDFIAKIGLEMEGRSGGHLFAPARALFGRDQPGSIKLPGESTILIHQQLKMDGVDTSYATQSVPAYRNDVARFMDHWQSQAKRQAVLVVCHNDQLRQRLTERLETDGHPVQAVAFPLTTDLPPGFYMAEGRLDTGFTWPERHLVVFSEEDIFSRQEKARKPSAAKGKEIFQTEFRDLRIGDLVVHLDHGIGKFLGLVEMEAGGQIHEMMAIAYRDNQKLYVNLNQLDLIQRYSAGTHEVALDKMGGVTWAKAKNRVRKAIRELAGELLQLYAQREVVQGHAYGADTEWQAQFEAAFEHEPTEGQLQAIADIKQDLGKPMDRLLVGDVGFGKTEVAMRMAFKVVMEGLQVAVLCPTTVLAFQHYHTFLRRFEGFPMEIRWISRFTGTEETKDALRHAASGKTDILIGTHRILSQDVQFKNLGGVIIDEEQRFGVAHKERLKHLRKKVDALSMSATPIPRTLNMAMSGVREISVIDSPPRNRIAISTMVAESRPGLIRNAIEMELDRGGQVFFIHNRVETMDTVAGNIKGLVPNAEVAMAHGQMEAKRIEQVMLDFMERKIDVLVASTIIENGVDIPNANTMIVNRADKFGMSQLYQLRGRIGRSDRPAYAYLLVPARARMTETARKRLATLEEFSDLGSGFRIAAMDMELRGAGNLLGGEQAGHINAIGYEMYIKLLEEAIADLKGTPVEDEVHCAVNLGFGAAIPRKYIEETNQRLSYYKKLAGARTTEEIQKLRATFLDCYGPLPPVAEQLCREHELRVLLASRKVTQVEREKERLKIRFHESAEVNSEIVLTWVRERAGVSLTPEGVVILPLESREPESVIAHVLETVDALIL